MIYEYMGHILNTVFGMYQQPFDKEWDSMLNMLIVFGTVVALNDYTVTFKYDDNHYTVWIGNKYYSYAWLRSYNYEYEPVQKGLRPKFKTMLRLNKLVTKLTQPS